MGIAFIKIANIPGESTNEKHADWIEALSFSHGVTQEKASSGRSSAGGASGGQSYHSDFVFTHHLDKSSPKLALACCKADDVGKVEIELCRQTGDETCYMKYTLEGVIVSSVRPGGAGGGDGVPLEEVSLNYAKIAWSYTPTNHETGEPEGPVDATWDVTKNKE
jgi:type VI secretion system secreted protein Hcp